ncbi:MAG: hypothetical protein ACT4QG_13585 [Sporichthyaceae bacterium]
MNRRTVTVEAIKRSVARSTKGSAAIEGRTVPEGFVRSAAAQELINGRQPRA